MCSLVFSVLEQSDVRAAQSGGDELQEDGEVRVEVVENILSP